MCVEACRHEGRVCVVVAGMVRLQPMCGAVSVLFGAGVLAHFYVVACWLVLEPLVVCC
jgi:hypothetical protein